MRTRTPCFELYFENRKSGLKLVQTAFSIDGEEISCMQNNVDWGDVSFQNKKPIRALAYLFLRSFEDGQFARIQLTGKQGSLACSLARAARPHKKAQEAGAEARPHWLHRMFCRAEDPFNLLRDRLRTNCYEDANHFSVELGAIWLQHGRLEVHLDEKRVHPNQYPDIIEMLEGSKPIVSSPPSIFVDSGDGIVVNAESAGLLKSEDNVFFEGCCNKAMYHYVIWHTSDHRWQLLYPWTDPAEFASLSPEQVRAKSLRLPTSKKSWPVGCVEGGFETLLWIFSNRRLTRTHFESVARIKDLPPPESIDSSLSYFPFLANGKKQYCYSTNRLELDRGEIHPVVAYQETIVRIMSDINVESISGVTIWNSGSY